MENYNIIEKVMIKIGEGLEWITETVRNIPGYINMLMFDDPIVNIGMSISLVLLIMLFISTTMDIKRYRKNMKDEKETDLVLSFFDDCEPDICFDIESIEKSISEH